MAIKGAIIGDIIGSQYEFKRPKDFNYKTALLLTDKCNFTDDTVMTLATKYAIEHNISFANAYRMFGKKYPNVGYGSMFLDWIETDDMKPYGSYGNGSAMRVSYIADHYNNISIISSVARESAKCTHNSPEGIKGAVVTATCIWMAKSGYSKSDILDYAIAQYPKEKYAYSPELSLDELKTFYHWDSTCQGSVPATIRCVYEANNYTEFIRNVFQLNCDTDTLCAIGGGIAEELFDNTYDEIIPFANKILKEYLDEFLLNCIKYYKII